MPRFEPRPRDEVQLDIDGVPRRFTVVEHPQAPGMVHSMEGAKAFVYHLDETAAGKEHALKVMRSRFREPALVDVCAGLDRLKSYAGLDVCGRVCLSAGRAAPALALYPSLEYAILMPWMAGSCWVEVLQRRSALDQAQARALAGRLAEILARLENDGIAHCDLSSANVVVEPERASVELIDVEDMFTPDLRAPQHVPAGTAGYQHASSHLGQWGRYADRFAGGILISEMLGWYDATVRAASYGESFFDPAELQRPASGRHALLAAAIARQNSQAAVLLQAAWDAAALAGCPPLAEWVAACQPEPPVRWEGRIARRPSDVKPLVEWLPRAATATPSPAPPPVTWEGQIARRPTGGGPPVVWEAPRPPAPAADPATASAANLEEEASDGQR